MPTEDRAGRWIGVPLLRREDRRLLQGKGTFVGDLSRRGMLHAAFVRATCGAGRLASVDVAAAQALPGVRAVLLAANLGVGALRAELLREEFVATDMPVLADGEVRHVGEPVALVVADDAYLAEDAAEEVVVDYEDLMALTSTAEALEPAARRVHEDLVGNVFLDVRPFDDPEVTSLIEEGGAEVTVSASVSTGRLSALPLEGRGCLAEWVERDGQLVLHVSTQVPHQVRTAVARCLGLREGQVRVVVPDVGGGFGLKCVVGREEIAVAAAARLLGRPVRWVEDRWENLAASFHGHEQHYEVRAACDAEGRLLALDADIVCDVGAYSAFPFTSGVEALMAAGELPGAYKVPRYRARARAVATNKAPTAPYRGVSRPQITLVMERLIEGIADRLGLDALEVRRRNLIGAGDFPYHGANDIWYDAGSYLESLELCRGVLDAEGWFRTRTAAQNAGDLVGIGFSCFNERTAYGTATFAQRQMAMTPGFDTATARMDPSGGVVVTTGTCSHGQGHETTLAQIAADQLGLHPDEVRVRQGDTDAVAYGWGTFGSRSAVIGGGAVKIAAERLGDRLRELAAGVLEAAAEDVILRRGRAEIAGSPGASVSLASLGQLAYFDSDRLPEGLDAGLEASATYDPPGTFSNATHGVVVRVDAGTGGVQILRYVVVEDCGVVINPLVVDGQVRGGVAQGIGAALLEGHHYDPAGQLLTGNLMDYLAPTAAEVPVVEIRHLETPSCHSETGAKGMGEGGTIGAPAAVLNALNDALRGAGVSLDDLPVHPERLVDAAARLGDPAERPGGGESQ